MTSYDRLIDQLGRAHRIVALHGNAAECDETFELLRNVVDQTQDIAISILERIVGERMKTTQLVPEDWEEEYYNA